MSGNLIWRKTGDVWLKEDADAAMLPEAPSVVRLTLEQVQELKDSWNTHESFWKRCLGLALLKKSDISIDLAGVEHVVARYEDAREGYNLSGKLSSACQRVVNGGKTNSQLEIEHEAAALAKILLRSN